MNSIVASREVPAANERISLRLVQRFIDARIGILLAVYFAAKHLPRHLLCLMMREEWKYGTSSRFQAPHSIGFHGAINRDVNIMSKRTHPMGGVLVRLFLAET